MEPCEELILKSQTLQVIKFIRQKYKGGQDHRGGIDARAEDFGSHAAWRIG
jgi:hypothetical protein